ncbi:Microtubules assembly and stabilization protein [Lecanora helva]
MEGIHGVDVSWLHHSPKDPYANKISTPTSVDTNETPPPRKIDREPKKVEPASPKPNGTPPYQHQSHIHRPHITHRQNSEKSDATSPSTSRSTRDPKGGTPSRRNSWMSSISSKFSSNSNPPSTSAVATSPTATKGPSPSPTPDSSNPFGAANTPPLKDAKKSESPASGASSSPKTGHTFISSALRRLSSSGGSSIGKASGTGPVCQRKTMNVDPYRERCAIQNLDPKKLRRVAFCVDVEIAGAAQYVDEEPEEPTRPSLEGESSLTKMTHEAEAKKKKDQKLKKSEGAALRNPDAVAEEKEKDGVIKASGEAVKNQEVTEPKSNGNGEVKEPTRKREKKKRSEGERRERKERKHQQALANGTIPAEVKRENSDASGKDSSNSSDTPHNQDRPTTDPLRIYRRCCQLRETPILKRIAEQIASPSACPVATPGIVSCLDLSGFWMQLPDIITLGDYLAVVPVKRLILENCGLGDEGVRVILAGLLAAKTPEQAKHNKKLGKRTNGREKQSLERLGVIEKISIKNNPKIGKEGWRHLLFFINMSRSIKAIDLSMIPFPQSSVNMESAKHHSPNNANSQPTPQIDMSTLLQEAIAQRRGGNRLEELVMGECGLDTDCIAKLVDGVMRCGVTRLGLASNDLTREGLEHVIRFLRSGKCEGLDLGGNDLHEDLKPLADALDSRNPLFALSLADCHLLPSSLEELLPALVELTNFRFIDLSHNRELFTTRPTALNNIRKYLPQCRMIKRIHLMDVAMTPEHAIALAEVLPESHTLAHLNILENHNLVPLASAKTEAEQEEACALYASLMAAVRVSDSIICVDIDVPSADSSEVVKALAKQVVAYSLHNLERLPLLENPDTAKAAITDQPGGEHPDTVPDILLHLVGHVDGVPENHDHDPPAPDDDYIVGGTGVVKALDICLNRACAGRKNSFDTSPLPSGTATPQKVLQGSDVSKGKAKEMSKNLLSSARKIRGRLQPALLKEAKCGDEMNYRRLKWLDTTLEGMIQRFEDEFPETRLSKPSNDFKISTTPTGTFSMDRRPPPEPTLAAPELLSPEPEDDSDSAPIIRPESLSRRPSTPSLASRQAQEEGRMHRFGQRMKREVLRPETEDFAHGTSGTESEAEYLQDLRRRLESFEGSEIQAAVENLGPDGMFDAVGASEKDLKEWQKRDPKGYERLMEARADALKIYNSQGILGRDGNGHMRK